MALWQEDCGGHNNARPQDVQVLIPRTHGYVTLYGKRDSSDVIKRTDFEMKGLSWII